MGRLKPTPVQLTIIEDNRGQEGILVAVDEAKIWIEWPTPDSEELVYWSKLRDKRVKGGWLSPGTREFTRKPKFLTDDSFIAEVAEDHEGGGRTVALIRFDRCGRGPLKPYSTLDSDKRLFGIQKHTPDHKGTQ